MDFEPIERTTSIVSRRAILPPEATTAAVETLKAGHDLKFDVTFTRYSRARYLSLRVRKHLLPHFDGSLKPSTHVWEDDDGQWRFLITLREEAVLIHP